MDQFGESNDLWHWREQLFWGQETPVAGVTTFRVTRSWEKARIWSNAGKNLSVAGFRPVLEPLAPSIEPAKLLIGTYIEVWGPQAVPIRGQFAGFDDYDLILRGATALPDDYGWAHTDGFNAVISRKDILYMRMTM